MNITTEHLNQVHAVLDGEEDLSIDRCVDILRGLDEAYYEDDPLVEDLAYDAFRSYAKALDDKHPYFAEVGAAVRGGKVELPYPLGSLNQVEIGGLDDWKRKNKIKPTDILVVTAKLDGASGLATLDRGELKRSFSRGDGYRGADNTRHLKNIITGIDSSFTANVRGEVIIGYRVFESTVQQKVVRSGGGRYKNPRNCVAGLMNASSIDNYVYQFIDFVAYDYLGCKLDKLDQLKQLDDVGFMVPKYISLTAAECTEDRLSAFIQELRDTYGYEIDGVVVDVNDHDLRAKLNAENEDLNPEFAFKYKVADASNYAETEVVRVEWNLSKSGYYKPRVIVQPAKLPGITWTYATGYNAKWIFDNGVGPGARVAGQRMGDVVPNIIRVLKSVDPQMPDDFVWNHTGVDAVARNVDDHEEVWIQQLVHAVSKIDFPHLKEGGIRQVVDALGTRSFNSTMKAILLMDESEWLNIVGANGTKIYDGIQAKMGGIDYHIFVGSMPHFGRGVGTRKMKKVFEVCKDLVGFKLLEVEDIINIDGFEETTATKIVDGIDKFFEFYDSLSTKPTFKSAVVEGAVLNGHGVCITGFRDKALDAWVEANGGKVQSGVSGNTTILIAADVKSNSGKVKKANELNASGKGKVEIMTLAQFNQTFGR